MFDRLGLVMVVVSDMDRSVSYYRDVLGLSLKYQTPGWSEFDMGGVGLGLHLVGGTLEVNPKTGISFGFTVSDYDAVTAELRGRGANIVHEDREEFGRLALVADPDGYIVQVCELARASA